MHVRAAWWNFSYCMQGRPHVRCSPCIACVMRYFEVFPEPRLTNNICNNPCRRNLAHRSNIITGPRAHGLTQCVAQNACSHVLTTSAAADVGRNNALMSATHRNNILHITSSSTHTRTQHIHNKLTCTLTHSACCRLVFQGVHFIRRWPGYARIYTHIYVSIHSTLARPTSHSP